jgi:hypothetical protein
MKGRASGWSIFLLALCSLVLLSCSGGGGSGSGSGGSGDTGLRSEDLFYANMQDTTPVYSLTTSQSARTSALAAPNKGLPGRGAWGDPDILYSVFFTLREFQSPRDEGVVDRSNFYKLLYDAETVLSYAYTQATELPEPTLIASPFAGIDTGATQFTHAANVEDEELSIAYRQTDETLEALVTWIWRDDGNPLKAERGIAYYVLNKTTHDVSIDMVYSVDYDTSNPESTYNLRCKARGNTVDHSFEFNYLIGTTAIIAKGVSQGDGQYMIFKYSTGGEANYLRVPADSGEDFFIGLYENPVAPITDPEELEDENEYLVWITEEPFMTQDDLLTSTEQLNIGDEESAGTVYLNF